MCAASPMRSSGAGRPSVCRIGRLSHGPGSAACGQVPSLSEPRMTTSGCCRRASNGLPDGDARMRGAARADVLVGDEAAVEIGVVGRRHVRRRQLAVEQAGEELRRRARRPRPATAASAVRRRRRRQAPRRLRRGPRRSLQAAAWPTRRTARSAARRPPPAAPPACAPPASRRAAGAARRDAGAGRLGDRPRARSSAAAMPSRPLAEVGRAERGELERARAAPHVARRQARAGTADASAAP